jgi:hypothetical protein
LGSRIAPQIVRVSQARSGERHPQQTHGNIGGRDGGNGGQIQGQMCPLQADRLVRKKRGHARRRVFARPPKKPQWPHFGQLRRVVPRVQLRKSGAYTIDGLRVIRRTESAPTTRTPIPWHQVPSRRLLHRPNHLDSVRQTRHTAAATRYRSRQGQRPELVPGCMRMAIGLGAN